MTTISSRTHRLRRGVYLAWAITILTSSLALAFELPATSRQCLVGIADTWDSSSATLQLYQKKNGRWIPDGDPWPCRLGKNGLVWGLGIHPNPPGATLKREGDARSPAGVFTIGNAWGYAANVPHHPQLHYQQISSRDLWIEDPSSPNYNRHLLLPHEPTTPWEIKQQMRQKDPAHALKLFIAHNAAPQVVPHGGSSIFFHIWRGGGSKPTAGCTSMQEKHLLHLIRRIDPMQRPLYILMPKQSYQNYRNSWKLP